MFNEPFTLKRKVGLIWKILPVAAVGYAVYAITSGQDAAKGPPEIVDPIEPK